ncbi:MAG: DUF3375 family protein [Gammaproteobacteria bacterium]|nr:DUF3375 family protein [Gammaproteobacteria bacterium]
METDIKRKMQSYISSRREHPAWRLLASQTAPSVLSSLQGLFEDYADGVDFEAAVTELSEVLRAQSAADDIDIINNDFSTAANKEQLTAVNNLLLCTILIHYE